MNEPVTLTVDAGVASIELNRPASANSIDLELASTLHEKVRQAEQDDDVLAVVVTGAGARFCAGGDVTSFVEASDPAAYLHELATSADAAVQALAGLSKPVVAGVHGAVAGAGLGVMLSCDLIVADPATKFAFAYPAIGLTPDCGVSWLLPRAIGQQRALSFALSGRALTGAEALNWGLVTELSDGVPERARQLATSLAATSPGALGTTRHLLRRSWDTDRATAGQEEARVISERVATPEAQTLIARFLKR